MYADVEGQIPLHLTFTHPMDDLDSPLLKTLSQNRTKSCAEILLKADPGMINQKDLEKRTILHQSTGENNIQLVELLTNIPGCNVNAQDMMKRTPLHYAAVAGLTPIVELLLSREADDSVQDSIGASPLHYACSKNHAQCVTALLCRESESVYAPDHEGRFPLVWACAKGHVQTCRTLLDFAVDPSAKDKYGATALHSAAFVGQTKCALLLIERGADVNAIDDQHQTALFRAAERK